MLYVHFSNAVLATFNPGLNTLQFCDRISLVQVECEGAPIRVSGVVAIDQQQFDKNDCRWIKRGPRRSP
jgi:hypothetical protein